MEITVNGLRAVSTRKSCRQWEFATTAVVREQLDIGDEELLQFVEAWIDDLARGDFAGAFARTKHDPYYGWTPDLTASFRVEAVADGVEIFLEDIHVY